MNSALKQQSTRDLLTLAQEQGYTISQAQLMRWHRAGLLPKPRQASLGKGKGTQSLYPERTATQLLLLCKLHLHERRLSHLGWQLWWAGYPVSLHIIRNHLYDASAHLTSRVHYFSALKQSDNSTKTTSDYLSEQVLNLIEHVAEDRLDYKPLRRARKRTGKESFSTFVRILIDIASGTFTGITMEQEERETLIELRILAQGLGLEKLFTRNQANIEYYVANFFVPLLQRLSSWFITCPWEQTLVSIADFDLMRVRDEFHTYILRLQQTTQKRLLDAREYPQWDSAFLDIFSHLTVEEQASLMLIWLSLAKSSLFDESGL